MVKSMDTEHIIKRMARFTNKVSGLMGIYRNSDYKIYKRKSLK